MRLDHDILQGAMPSMQNVERITSDHNLRLDKMAGTYMRSNQDVFPNHHASNDWVDGQIIPRLIAESKQDSSKVKIGRFMSRLGENYLYHHSQFEDEIKVFFDGLAKNIVEPRNLPKGTTLTSNVKGKSRDEILLNTIATAENQITTAFVAALFLIHQTQGIQHSWDPILKSGWDFIKSFCSKDLGDHLMFIILSQ
ncbi:hypothetical protein DFH28DRAFT_1084334 [Melampsora americana]|nr:hypothetical protein DFH28DRAFT_1084334 [Melampsora americana]